MERIFQQKILDIVYNERKDSPCILERTRVNVIDNVGVNYQKVSLKEASFCDVICEHVPTLKIAASCLNINRSNMEGVRAEE
jgi:hypothetical protein